MEKISGRISKEKQKKRGFIDLVFRNISTNFISPIIAKIASGNQVTLFNTLVISPLTGLCFAISNHYAFPLIGCVLIVIRSLIDRVDGEVAKIRKELSEKGELLDDLTDRFSVMIIFLGFVFGTYNETGEISTVFIGLFGLFGIATNTSIILLDKDKYIKFISYLKKLFYLPYYLMIPAAIIGKFWVFLILISVFANIRTVILFIDFFFIKKENKIIKLIR